MSMIPMFLKEMKQEAVTTRKMLERVPEDKFGWKPHPKSMSLLQLATHVAELPSWTSMALKTNELDFAANPYDPPKFSSTAELLQYFEESLKSGLQALESAREEQLNEPWTLRTGDTIHVVEPKGDVIRMSYCQTVHHRAQLGVYLRLLDIPIPGSYGPSADEQNF
ncbi:DinB family protein [Flavihumibacter stibioxidans]|uniref:Damage-inducible protein DinB n=1 Tax=Flavihumibacter stibioxidans TaxID=1834163 RepID=A0ABR7M8Q7_9BACT|nr:DinB family protein [Flavihumibacter stibioxidans]MBC6491420.1 damage-inducible protein DinB [Flavihumibacter stibioxidans]